MATVQEAYRAVWADMQSRGATVQYQGMYPSHLGFFSPGEPKVGSGAARPSINIYRQGYGARTPMFDEISADLIERELWTLGHECGHFLWWKRGWDGDVAARDERTAYFAAFAHYEALEKGLAAEVGRTLDDAEYTRRLGATMRDGLSFGERDLILAEEQRAWDLGRELLGAHGAEADVLTRFDAKAIVGVNHYFVRLGVIRPVATLAGHAIQGIQTLSDPDVRSVAREMERLGPPTIRAILSGGRLYAIEGTHRLAAAQSLGLQPTIVVVADDDTDAGVVVRVGFGANADQTVAQLRATFATDNPCAPSFTMPLVAAA